jgi:hypothetical protein
VSVVAPAGGAYTSKPTGNGMAAVSGRRFRLTNCRNWLAANKGLVPGGHAIVSGPGHAVLGMAVMVTAATTLPAPASAVPDNPCASTLVAVCVRPRQSPFPVPADGR